MVSVGRTAAGRLEERIAKWALLGQPPLLTSLPLCCVVLHFLLEEEGESGYRKYLPDKRITN